jgi:transposase-like protein
LTSSTRRFFARLSAIESIAGKIGYTDGTLRKWVRHGERDDSGARPGPTSADKQRIKELEREVRELRKTNEILKLGSAYFAQAEPKPPAQEVNAFIDEHRARCEVEAICHALQVAPSAYRRHAARRRNPALLPARAQRDVQVLPLVQCVHEQNLQVRGLRRRQGVAPAQARRHGGGALHRRAADAAARAEWCVPT